MLLSVLLRKFFGSKNEREVKRLAPAVLRINALSAAMEQLSDQQ